MTTEQIEKFLGGNKEVTEGPAKIFFKTRDTIEGFFIKAPDYTELKQKNFWRIVSLKNSDDYKKSKDINLSRIFNGAEFTKLSQKG